MFLFSNKELRILIAELVVVVLGILIAFQVEEWRDGLREGREIQAALDRLAEETQINLELCKFGVPQSEELASLTLLLLDVLNTGNLEPADIQQFESGIANVNYIPTPAFASTVSDEMIATGLLKNIDDDELRRDIAGAVNTLALLAARFDSVESSLRLVADELARGVEFRYDGSRVPGELSGQGAFEESIEVEVDFERLAENRYLRNILVEASDSRIDRYVTIKDYCDTIERIDQALESPDR